uniref:Uncharacterized protein LOC114334569 n=1 Tax=Diabrotica virgifera virgifera TaxID=50390 RepID=A0A6P7G049_DIAVI
MLSDKQREVCNKYFGKIKDKVIRLFQAVNLRTVVPSSIHQPIDKEIEEEQSDEEVEEEKSDEEIEEKIDEEIKEGKSDIKQDIKILNMALTINEFLNIASKVLPNEFDGSAGKLQPFLDVLELLGKIAEGHEETAITLIKTRLTNKARNLITTEDTIPLIAAALKKELRGDNPKTIIDKLAKKRQGNKDAAVYASEVEELAEQLKVAYIAEGMPVELAKKYTTETVVATMKRNVNTDRAKLILEAGNFTTPQEVVSKFLSIDTTEENTQGRVFNYRTNYENRRGQQQYRRGYHNKYDRGRRNNFGQRNEGEETGNQRNYSNRGYRQFNNQTYRENQRGGRNRNVRLLELEDRQEETENQQLGF